MMGLSYETEPVYRKLETHLGDRIEQKIKIILEIKGLLQYYNK